ncbi:hypothetical protein [Luteibacter yeojuensis]|uniref:Uncharacterized protein n=1 Tax=Luteibacter yeojuensis TaxID=345309 RepID=A0A0F3KFU5_9GAMM|nr:hypothetical protein [Luteibacter yeojuensis]KJV30048.1 hypothetical protein VI08_15415 [Luteibacter yeojuensis]
MEKHVPVWALPLFVWILATYLFTGMASEAGFPPNVDFLEKHSLLLGLLVLLYTVPFLSKIKVGALLELERSVERAEKDLSEFKSQVASQLSVLSTSVNTISTVSNSLTVNIPGVQTLREAQDMIAEESRVEAKEPSPGDRDLAGSDERVFALVKARIDVEGALRRVLKRPAARADPNGGTRYSSVTKLFNEFLSLRPDAAYLKRPMGYFMEICGAVIHAQQITPAQAEEALALGEQIREVIEAPPPDGN